MERLRSPARLLRARSCLLAEPARPHDDRELTSRHVWQTIAETGEVPTSHATVDAQAEKRAAFNSFMEWFDGLPLQNEAYAQMTDDEILAGRVDDYA